MSSLKQYKKQKSSSGSGDGNLADLILARNPLTGGFYRSKQYEKQAEESIKATAQAEEKAAKAQEEAQLAKQKAASAQTQAEKEAALLEAEKKSMESQYTLEALARYYEAQKRKDLGLTSGTLDILGTTEEQLLQDELDRIDAELGIEQRGGIAPIKFPWKTSLGILGLAGVIYYWRRK